VKFGVPISCRINYLRDNRVQRIALASDFDISTGSEPTPAIYNLRLSFHVNDDDKDDNTRIDATIANGSMSLATFSNVGAQWRDQEDVPPFAFKDDPRIALRAFAGSQLHICEYAAGNDTFKFNVVLSADTTNGAYSAGFGGLTFDNGQCRAFALPPPPGRIACE
jgi:hypothetical protein